MAYLDKVLQIRISESLYEKLLDLWIISNSYSVSSLAREILIKVVLHPDCITLLRKNKIL